RQPGLHRQADLQRRRHRRPAAVRVPARAGDAGREDLQGHALDPERFAARADRQVAARTVAGHAARETAMTPRLVLVATVLLACAGAAQAAPDLRLGRAAGPLTVYPD